MDELQYLAFLAARKATADLRNETARSTLPTRAVPSERQWRHWRRRQPRHGGTVEIEPDVPERAAPRSFGPLPVVILRRALRLRGERRGPRHGSAGAAVP